MMGIVGRIHRGPRAAAILAALLLSACSGAGTLPPVRQGAAALDNSYLIGPGDMLNIFVWRNPELSLTVPVRPDGRISVPLIEDVPVTGKTPTLLARDLENKLKAYVQDPIVTVIVTSFNGPFTQQVRVIGEAAKPQAIPYRDNMSLLDVMISVGGVTKFAAGNRATIVRTVDGQQKTFRVHVDDLMRDGEVDANVSMQPGDVLIIPQAWF